MNPSLFSNFYITTFITISILTATVFSYTNTISYSDHCNSFVPEAIPTTSMFTRYPFLEPVTSHYTGGQNILGPDSPSHKSILFTSTENLFRTEAYDTFKIQAQLRLISSNIYQFVSNDSRFYRPLVFNLDGFWSESTNKLCMVGSAQWFSKRGKRPLKLDAVLKLINFARFISLNNSLVSGILESLGSVHDSDYFEPISMIGFPRVADFKYKYSLVSNEECDGVNGNFTKEHSVASIQSLNLCKMFRNQFKTYKLENRESGYPPSLPFSPSFLSLYAIQCSSQEKKLRFLVEFQERRFKRYDQSFDLNITLIGEGTWNGTKNELCMVACRILNRTDPLGSAHVGDCSVRLTVWFPDIRSIKNTHTTKGHIWSTKKAGDDGYFEPINFQSFDHSLANYGTKYEFTKLEKLRRVCPRRDVPRWKTGEYPSGYNGDMTLDFSVKHGNAISIGYAVPIFVGNQLYNSDYVVASNFNQFQAAAPSAATVYTGRMNISYEFVFGSFINSTSEPGRGIPLLSSTNNGRIQISAEGFYDSETGRLCMIGCRNLNSSKKESRNESFDCEILLRFRFPRTNRNDGSFLIRGSIQSLRERTDSLYFDRLTAVSLTYTQTQAVESLRRMDLEIIMDLISRTLSCLFIIRQLFYVKRNPEMIPLTSVLLMVILTLGYMVPLVLNLEAMFSNTRYLQNFPLGGGGGLLEVNEVIVRIVTMVAFILQFRLLQLTWSAKFGNENNGNGNGNGNGKSHWNHEIRTLLLCLPIYIIGGLIMLLVNWNNNDYITSSQRSIWGDLRSYTGLTLDGFLFPQIILNIFQISKGNALSGLFYTGNTFVRLLPHAYDLLRGQINISQQFDRFYLYANPRVDFYSPSWDVSIACGGVVFAVIVFLQQCFGGRFMLPKRFRETVEYEMVPVVNNE
ncbi:hypothetical protein L1887_39490 [Cichorium endivia]|nr:hypothetical protein L1887_39482 [Cichorium endivia]KAI3497102.1 hypothetical protein L1887_39486 [Cichorium endivia]KAI3497106.1 hypothetical protein L1887_39490 [Cichorium endivia]